MSTLKLIGLGVAWLLTSLAVAFVGSIVFTELLDVIGLVESGEASYTITINAVLVVIFLGLALTPFIFRSRFVGRAEDEVGE